MSSAAMHMDAVMGDASSASSSAASKNVRVLVRIRPYNERELATSNTRVSCVTANSSANTIELNTKPESKVFTFDAVADVDVDQDSIFNSCGKPITDACLQGYNGTIFAYGQTGSGKTFTLQGADSSSSSNNKSQYNRGLMPRVFDHLFETIIRQTGSAAAATTAVAAPSRMAYSSTAATAATTVPAISTAARSYTVKLSFLEIYQERIYDLLDPMTNSKTAAAAANNNSNSDAGSLQIREDGKSGVFVENLIEEVVTSAAECVALMTRGIANRRVGETAMNRESSRSHSVLTLHIYCTDNSSNNNGSSARVSRFNLIDLAGSERQKDTLSGGQRLKEATNINKSLSALGNVIMSLVDRTRHTQHHNRHVAYRDSKLTYLLRDSLGGNSLTHVIACVSPSVQAFSETLSTLQFAARAKSIKNHAVVNETNSNSSSSSSGGYSSGVGAYGNTPAEVIAMQAEIAKLQAEVALFNSGSYNNSYYSNSNNSNWTQRKPAKSFNTPSKYSNSGDSLITPSTARRFRYNSNNNNNNSSSNTPRLSAAEQQQQQLEFEQLLLQSMAREAYAQTQVTALQQHLSLSEQQQHSYQQQHSADTLVLKLRDRLIARLEQQQHQQQQQQQQPSLSSFVAETIAASKERHSAAEAELHALKQHSYSSSNTAVIAQQIKIHKLQQQVLQQQQQLSGFGHDNEDNDDSSSSYGDSPGRKRQRMNNSNSNKRGRNGSSSSIHNMNHQLTLNFHLTQQLVTLNSSNRAHEAAAAATAAATHSNSDDAVAAAVAAALLAASNLPCACNSNQLHQDQVLLLEATVTELQAAAQQHSNSAALENNVRKDLFAKLAAAVSCNSEQAAAQRNAAHRHELALKHSHDEQQAALTAVKLQLQQQLQLNSSSEASGDERREAQQLLLVQQQQHAADLQAANAVLHASLAAAVEFQQQAEAVSSKNIAAAEVLTAAAVVAEQQQQELLQQQQEQQQQLQNSESVSHEWETRATALTERSNRAEVQIDSLLSQQTASQLLLNDQKSIAAGLQQQLQQQQQQQQLAAAAQQQQKQLVDKQFFELACLQEDHENLMETHNYHEATIEQQQKQLAAATTQLAAVQQQYDDTLLMLNSSNSKNSSNTEAAAADAADAADAAAQRLDSLSNHNIVLQVSLEQLKATEAAAQQQQQQLQQQVNDLHNVNSQLDQRCSDASNASADAQLQQQALLQQCERLAQQLRDSEATVLGNESEANTLQHALEQQQQQYTATLDRYNDSQRNNEHQLAVVNSQCEQLSRSNSELVVACGTAEQVLEALQQQQQQEQQQSIALQQQCEQQQAIIAALEASKQQLEQNLSHINSIAATLAEARDTSTATAAFATSAAATATAAGDELLLQQQQRHDVLQSLHNAATAKLSDTQQQLLLREQTYIQLTLQYDAFQQAKQQEQQELAEENEQLQEAATAASSTLQQLQQQQAATAAAEANDRELWTMTSSDLQRQLDEQNDLIESLQDETGDSEQLQAQLAAATAQVEQQQQQQQEWLSELEAAHAQEHAALLAVDALQQKHSALSNSHEHVNALYHDSQQQHKAVAEQLVTLIGHQNSKQKIHYVSALKAENDALQLQAAKLEREAKRMRGQLLLQHKVSSSISNNNSKNNGHNSSVDKENTINGVDAAATSEAAAQDKQLLLAQKERGEEEQQLLQAQLERQQLQALLAAIAATTTAAVVPAGSSDAMQTDDAEIDATAVTAATATAPATATSAVSIATAVQQSIGVVQSLLCKVKDSDSALTAKDRELRVLQQQLQVMQKRYALSEQQQINSRYSDNTADNSVLFAQDE